MHLVSLTGAAAQIRVNAKLSKYREQSRIIKFQPLVAETLGGWDSKAKFLLKQIGHRVAVQEGIEQRLGFQNLMTNLSISLQKLNATMITERSVIC